MFFFSKNKNDAPGSSSSKGTVPLDPNALILQDYDCNSSGEDEEEIKGVNGSSSVSKEILSDKLKTINLKQEEDLKDFLEEPEEPSSQGKI